MRPLRTIVLPLLAGCLLAGCGGGDDNAKGPPGSESNPLAAVPNPSATRTPPVDHPAGEAGGTATSKSGARRTVAPASSSCTRTQHGSAAPKKAAGGSETGAATRPRTARKQKALPASAGRPCSLVTKTQAKAIVGAPIVEPLEAPQGPTCIFQTKAGKPYVTVAVQTLNFAKLRKQIRNAHTVSIASRTAYCGTYGKPMLYLPLAGGRVLSIAAPCGMAARFAAKAAPRL
jgi:hypothetical protein